jgi:hypothetical protein
VPEAAVARDLTLPEAGSESDVLSIEPAKLDKRGGTMVLTKSALRNDTREFQVEGRTVRVMTRPADGFDLARLFELEASPSWDEESPMTADDLTAVMRGLMDHVGKQGELPGVLGVPPEAAASFPDDPRIYVSPVEPMSFSLPGSPTGLVLHMDEHGDGHIWALGEDRVSLGSDGMWWIVATLIDALAEPAAASIFPRILTLGIMASGSATQASLRYDSNGVGIEWRKLRHGVAGDIVAVQKLTYDRVDVWLKLLIPIRDDLERRRVHRQRLRPARMAEKWARAQEHWDS